MKKLFYSAIVVLTTTTIVSSCKKDDSKTDNNNNPTPTASIVGSWNGTKIEEYSLPNDRLVETDTVFAKLFQLTFNANNTFSGKVLTNDDSGTYSMFNANSKTYLVMKVPDESADTMQIEKLTSTQLIWNDREKAVREGDDSYTKYHFNKK
ncbi:MAG: hypothetical protein ACK4K9_02020 [Bacteroidia bacterium]